MEDFKYWGFLIVAASSKFLKKNPESHRDGNDNSLVLSREWGKDYYRGPSRTIIGIHSPIPYEEPVRTKDEPLNRAGLVASTLSLRKVGFRL